MGSDDDGRAEVLRLKATQQGEKKMKAVLIFLCTSRLRLWGRARCRRSNLEHGFSLFRQGNVVYPHGEAEGVGEEDGSVHRVDRTVSDMEQCGRVVEAQVADRQDGKR